MGGRSFAILGLAVGCGLVAMYGVNQLIGGKDQPVVMKDVLIAARDLRAEEILKPDMYKLVQVPADKVDPGAISDPKALEGRWVEIPMLSGETIVEGKLAAKDAVPGLPGRIPPGMRAFSIEVSEESGVAGFVLPGYHVDIIQEIRDESNPRRRPPARLVLQDVLVLAAGQVVTRGEDKSINVRTVTLAVEPDQAETLVAARTRGPLSLALRGLDDHEVVARPDPKDEDPEPLVALTPLVAPLPDRRPTPPPQPVSPPAPRRRTLIIHGLQHPVTIHHRIDPDPMPPVAGPAVASAAPVSTASARRPPGTLATP